MVLPPLPEQRRIAEILDTLDEAIRTSEQLIAKLKQVKQGLLHDLLTRGIDENGELRDPGRNPESFRDVSIGKVPWEWQDVRLASVARRITDGTHQPVSTESPSDGSVPFLYVSCVRDGLVDWDAAAHVTRRTFAEISRGREPEMGMVLYTAVGSFGHAAAIHDGRAFAFQRHIACIYPLATAIDSDFLAMWLNSDRVRAWADRTAVGNAQRTVTLGELSRCPVLLPSLAEQKRISAVASGLDARVRSENGHLDKLRLLKHGLMDDLLTGRVRATSRTDEVAR